MRNNRHKPVLSEAKVLIVLLLCLPVALALLTIQTTPSVPSYQVLDEQEMADIERLLVDSAPSNVRDTQLQQLSLSGAELNLLIRYAAGLLESDPELTGRIHLPGELINAEASVPVLKVFGSLYLNIDAQFRSAGNRLDLESLRLGRIQVPGILLNSLARRLEARYLDDSRSYLEIAALLKSVQQISIAPDQIDLELLWEPQLISQIRIQAQRLLVSAADQARIVRHYQVLTDLTDALPDTTRAVTLASLMGPMFARAAEHSSHSGQAVAENRTLLLTLAAYVNNEDIGHWLDPDIAVSLPRARVVEVRIQRRQDLAQHVTFSAAIASTAGASLAQVLSSIKESYDARHRSGFSFSDYTANTAGLTLGRLATESETGARQMQQRISLLQDDTEYLPLVTDNQDGLSEADFNSLYRDASSVEFQARIGEIEAQVMQLPLFAEQQEHR